MTIDFNDIGHDFVEHANKTYGRYYNWSPDVMQEYLGHLMNSWEMLEEVDPDTVHMVALYTAIKLRMEMKRHQGEKIPYFHWITECFQDHWELVDAKIRMKKLLR